MKTFYSILFFFLKKKQENLCLSLCWVSGMWVWRSRLHFGKFRCRSHCSVTSVPLAWAAFILGGRGGGLGRSERDTGKSEITLTIVLPPPPPSPTHRTPPSQTPSLLHPEAKPIMWCSATPPSQKEEAPPHSNPSRQRPTLANKDHSPAPRLN